jgi:hypothetical protein
MKNKILVALLVVFSVINFSHLAFAFSCSLSCAAVCRYTCEGTPQSETGCSDQQYATKLQSCCEQAFANTPGIDQVACGGGGS